MESQHHASMHSNLSFLDWLEHIWNNKIWFSKIFHKPTIENNHYHIGSMDQ